MALSLARDRGLATLEGASRRRPSTPPLHSALRSAAPSPAPRVTPRADRCDVPVRALVVDQGPSHPSLLLHPKVAYMGPLWSLLVPRGRVGTLSPSNGASPVLENKDLRPQSEGHLTGPVGSSPNPRTVPGDPRDRGRLVKVRGTDRDSRDRDRSADNFHCR